MQRILHIIDSLDRRGDVRQLLIVARGFAEAGWDTHVVVLGPCAALQAEFEAAGISVHKLQRRWSWDPIAFLRLQRAVFRMKPHVVQTWTSHAAAHAQLLSRTTKLPRIVVGRYRVDPWAAVGGRFSSRRNTPAGKQVVTNSDYIRTLLASRGASADAVSVIAPAAPEFAESDVTRDELLRQLDLPPGARLIGVVGRLTPEKRVRDLIWAADLLRVLHDELRLLIIGEGPLRSELEQYARMASDLEHVRFLGERDDVGRILPHLDVLWNGSEPRGHSTAILEAMAAGVPVIASDTPFNRELISERETGYLIPLGSRAGRAARARHTDRIFNDSALRAELASASKCRARKHFSAQQAVAKHLELIG